MSKKKLFIILGVVVLLVVIVYFNMAADTSSATKVNAEDAEVRELVEKVSASGRIQPQTKVDITSEVTGEIIDLKAKEGDYVNSGELLIVIDTVQLRSDLDQAKFAVTEINARMDGAKASMDQAREEFDRQERLRKDSLNSETQYTNAKYTYLNAKSSYEASVAQSRQSQARYEKQLDNLSKAKIVAPMSGIITLLDCEVGEIAPAQNAFTQGRTLMTISNLDVFEVEVEVDETEINKIDLGQITDIEVDAFSDTVFPGEVVEIGNTALVSGASSQDQSTNFKVKVIFKDPNVKIRPGMSATVDIITNKNEGSLSVPYSSIIMRTFDVDSLEKAISQPDNKVVADSDDEESSIVSSVQAAESDDTAEVDEAKDNVERKDVKGVFVIRDGKAVFIKVATGIADHQNIEVTEGLQDGDKVISGPYSVLRSLRDGDEVKIIEKKDEKK